MVQSNVASCITEERAGVEGFDELEVWEIWAPGKAFEGLLHAGSGDAIGDVDDLRQFGK